MDGEPDYGIDRREALQWLASAAASIAAFELRAPSRPGGVAATGYGTDPILNRAYEPGAFWPLTFTARQRRGATALCDAIIPADDRSPAASTVGVPAFLDEWVSAPYPAQRADKKVVLDGLEWLDGEARRRFDADFADLTREQQRAVCDPICDPARAAPELAEAAAFFARFRNLTAGAFYSTRAGMADVGYQGNVPSAAFEGPSDEVLKRVGLG